MAIRSLRALSLSLTLCVGTAWFAAADGQTPGDAQKKEPPARTWVDATGKFKTDAVMLKYEKGTVYLKRTDGREVTVPLGRLSQSDQRWVRRELARKRERERSQARRSPRSSTHEAYWPGWRGPNRDGKSSDRGLLKKWPPGGPARLWQADDIGKGFSSVAVSEDTVYITGDTNGRLVLFAFHLGGSPKWKIPIDNAWTRNHPGSRATPTIDGDSLYLVSGHGLIGCYEAGSGRPRWIRNMREFGGSTPNWGYAESVLIHGNLAVVTPGGDSCIVALDKRSGMPVWTSQGVRAGAHYSSNYAFEHEGVPMIVNGTADGIVCVDPLSGRLLWSNPFSAGNTANCPTPVFSDGYVFWANGYSKGGICLKLTGERGSVSATEAWRTSDMVCHHGGYILHDGYIYGNHSNGWTCLDLKSGSRMWQERGVGKGSVCFADGMLYLFSESRGRAGLATCSPNGLEMKGEFSVAGEGPSWAHPVVVGGRLYLRYGTHLYCFNVRAGGS